MAKQLTIGDITREALRVYGLPDPGPMFDVDDDDDEGAEPLFPMDHIPHTNC